MNIPEVDLKKVKRTVRRNTLLIVGVGVIVTGVVLIRKMDDLQDAFLDLGEAVSDLMYAAYPLSEPVS